MLSSLQILANRMEFRKVMIGLHGGEPLLVKKSKFQEICDIILTNCGDVEVNFSVQTNGALIDDDWVTIFEKYNIGVGVSLDGPEAINDYNRFDKKGNGSHSECVNGFKKLRDYNVQKNISPPGLLCVIDPLANPKEIYRHFVEELGALSINYLVPNNTHDDHIDDSYVRKLGDFLIQTFKCWATSKRKQADTGFPLQK